MRIATMDVGTNSIRLLITEIGESTWPVQLYQAINTTRIGEGMAKNHGRLTPVAIQRTVQALMEFSAIAAKFSVDKHRVVATAAVRDALNGRELVELAQAKAGLVVKVISGEQEARLSYLGVIKGLAEVPSTAVVIDVGGGSTEVIWSSGEGRLAVESIPIGAVRATEAVLNEQQISLTLERALSRVANARPQMVIGVGGTATTLAAMNLGLELYDAAQVHGYSLKKVEVNYWHRQLSAASPDQRKLIPGLQPHRADIILAGVTIIKIILDKLNLEQLMVSETDLLWGLIFEEI